MLLVPFLVYGATSMAAVPQPPPGKVGAVGDLLDRVLPGSRHHFELELDAAVHCTGCYAISDGSTAGTIKITGRTASDLSAGVGAYLMDYANLTFGWPRGGGSHMVLPTTWYGIIHHRFFYTQIERMRH